jgi:hypothetical protein
MLQELPQQVGQLSKLMMLSLAGEARHGCMVGLLLLGHHFLTCCCTGACADGSRTLSWSCSHYLRYASRIH